MRSQITQVFGRIRAEDNLKAKTLEFLYSEINKRRNTRHNFAVKRLTYAAACVVCLSLITPFAYNLYYTENAYIDLDINPAVELSVNRFDRVIGVHAYNGDGGRIIDGLNIKHENYTTAVKMLIDSAESNGFIQDEGLISLTLQSDDEAKASELVSAVKTETESYVQARHDGAQVNVALVSGDIRNSSHELNITPAKYIAITELLEVDPAATYENYSHHSISKIKEITQSHGSGHYSGEGFTQDDTEFGDTSGEYEDGNHHGNDGGHN